MKAFVVANYVSGKGKCGILASEVIKRLENSSIDYSIFKTVDHDTDIKAIRDNINKCDLLICLGGDGTVNEVVNAAIAEGASTPIGYIPCGSTNDFATNYNLSCNPEKAMDTILRMQPRLIDVGELNGTNFCYVAAAGAFSEVSYATSRELKNVLGKAAYLLEGAKSVPKIKPINLRAEVNSEVFEGNYLIATFSNSSRIGGVFKFANGMIDYSDGLMELTLIEDPGNIADFLALIGDLVTGNLQNEFVHIIRTDSARIISDQGISWSLDGEYGGMHKETVIKALKQRISLLC